MRGSGKRAVFGAAVLCVLGAPAAARGDVACVYDATDKELAVTNDLGGPVTLSIFVGGEIRVSSGPVVACTGGTPTVTNTDRVTFDDLSPNVDGLLDIRQPELFAPGASSAGDAGPLNPDEIEFEVAFGGGPDTLRTEAASAGAEIRFGTEGVNANVSAIEVANDVDITHSGTELLAFFGGPGDDIASGAGGAGTGNAVNLPFDYGGAFPGLNGGEGDDVLRGGRADDIIDGDDNADVMDGGKGEDTATYLYSSSGPVEASIGGPAGMDGGSEDDDVPNETTLRDTIKGDVEALVGTTLGDLLYGDAGANTLVGETGADGLFGRKGADLLKAKDGQVDGTIACGPGDDRARRDKGLDPKPKSC